MTRPDKSPSMFDAASLTPAVVESFRKLDPRELVKNPVMFTVEMVALVATVIMVRDTIGGAPHIGFEIQIVAWLWVTVLFATFAEAVAEGRGKAQADTLRRMRSETMAKLLLGVDEGNELIREHAQYNKDTTVQNNRTATIKSGNDTLTVETGIREVRVKGDSSHIVEARHR